MSLDCQAVPLQGRLAWPEQGFPRALTRGWQKVLPLTTPPACLADICGLWPGLVLIETQCTLLSYDYDSGRQAAPHGSRNFRRGAGNCSSAQAKASGARLRCRNRVSGNATAGRRTRAQINSHSTTPTISAALASGAVSESVVSADTWRDSLIMRGV
ncbi:hypothetical protein Micbo1qcDRAFT_177037 [Microdochium bolleyi]|uniref:Uncharacterized protein n=1 Tax=Microdochium bolleyi TaxID=196109 RepID=A0A136IY20_9PEZI|nr:hypothetical protein Micbo1qcDRAFT_177037 [Microdochium bolleyi]